MYLIMRALSLPVFEVAGVGELVDVAARLNHVTTRRDVDHSPLHNVLKTRHGERIRIHGPYY